MSWWRFYFFRKLYSRVFKSIQTANIAIKMARCMIRSTCSMFLRGFVYKDKKLYAHILLRHQLYSLICEKPSLISWLQAMAIIMAFTFIPLSVPLPCLESWHCRPSFEVIHVYKPYIRSHTLISKGIGEHENFPYHPAGTYIIRTRGVDLFWRSGL